MKDYPLSVIFGMAKLKILIVKVYGELTKAWLRYAADKEFQQDGHQPHRAETLHQG